MNYTILLAALIAIESGGDPRAYNKAEKAVGILQVRKLAIIDVNEEYGTGYKLEHCYDPDTAITVCVLYLRRWGADSYEKAARIWCGGPDGPEEDTSLPYWRLVEAEIKRITKKE